MKKYLLNLASQICWTAHSLSPLSRSSRSIRQSPKKKNWACKILGVFSLGLTLACNAAFAGGGGGFAGATEFTQIANNLELGSSYIQQLTAYSMQIQQYNSQLQNMMLNPASINPQNVNNLIQRTGQIMGATNSIGASQATVTQNFANTYQSPQAASFAAQYQNINQTTTSTLGAALASAGSHRDAQASDAQNLQTLYDASQNSQGELAALQTLSQIVNHLDQQIMKMIDLISTQNIASSTYMASQQSATQAVNAALGTPDTTPVPSMSGTMNYPGTNSALGLH